MSAFPVFSSRILTVIQTTSKITSRININDITLIRELTSRGAPHIIQHIESFETAESLVLVMFRADGSLPHDVSHSYFFAFTSNDPEGE